MLGNRPTSEWIAEYSRGHQHPVNRACHTIGIPVVALSVALLLLSVLFHGLFVPGLTLFVVGWIFQFVGHYFEGKPPEFFKDPRFLLVGLRWWAMKLMGKA